MQFKTLEIRRQNGLMSVTLNRPHALNALNALMVDELHSLLDTLSADLETRVVILRGAGRHFCSGLDLKESAGDERYPFRGSVDRALRFQHRMSELVLKIYNAPQPFIAAVKGAAAGGGFALALAADVRLAGESARFNAAFIRVGVSACDMGVSYFLPRAVGMSVAAELMYTGHPVDARRALAVNLVSEVVADDELDRAAEKLAGEMLATSALGLRLTKEGLHAGVDAPSLPQAIAIEDRNQVLCGLTGEMKEGIRAFIEKRAPRFSAEANRKPD